MSRSVSFSDFQKIDLRVGKVIQTSEVLGSKNLLRMQVSFGPLGERMILAGLKGSVKKGRLTGRKFIFVLNLEPKKMMKEISEGMILVSDDNSKITLIGVRSEIKEGSKVR